MYICTRKNSRDGTLAQSVERRTENPGVPGSIPGGTTRKAAEFSVAFLIFIKLFHFLYKTKLIFYLCGKYVLLPVNEP